MKRWVSSLMMVVTSVLLVGPVVAAPDFTGIWDRYPFPYDDSDADPPPPGGEPPLKEPYASAYKDYRQRKDAAEKRGRPLVDDSTRCLPEGMPTIMGAIYPLEFLHTPTKVVMLAEFLTQTRRILLNKKMPPIDEISPSYAGYSVGHWEGDTLVVETRGVREDVKFAPWGIPHSRQMKVTERLRLTAPDLLEDRITIEDPVVLSKPYSFTFGYKKNTDYDIVEYICDNNHNVINDDGSISLDVKPR